MYDSHLMDADASHQDYVLEPCVMERTMGFVLGE